MLFQINCTQDGVIKYPAHKHDFYEIMFYASGTGYLETSVGNFRFFPGRIIIVPPGISHGSSSDNGFKNISIVGDFEKILYNKEILTLVDNNNNEAAMLVKMIYNNRFGNKDYLSALCSAYLRLLVIGLNNEDKLSIEIKKIIYKISENYFDSEININEYLEQSGYAPDYIRAQFKKATGKTPGAFLTQIRIKQACFLTDIYGDTLQMQEIAEKCGYVDYSYFSKKFKSVMNISPSDYKKQRQKASALIE